ncbi:hypothetical protein ABT203_14170 [Streptomyces sp900105245]|uniref:hypothetical protein n=1 Tax=Streptomyces sp. 900105245 TaxID=3154379 RepID=UPI00332DB326
MLPPAGPRAAVRSVAVPPVLPNRSHRRTARAAVPLAPPVRAAVPSVPSVPPYRRTAVPSVPPYRRTVRAAVPPYRRTAVPPYRRTGVPPAPPYRRTTRTAAGGPGGLYRQGPGTRYPSFEEEGSP